jgi:hypothetical protein
LFLFVRLCWHRAALKLLKSKHPQWILLGCQAHALSLLIKDLCRTKEGGKRSDCEWGVSVADAGLHMSNMLSDSDKVRSALTKHQEARGGTSKAIRTHCPTRFGIIPFIISDLYGEREAIRAMVMDDDEASDTRWAVISASCKNADTFVRLATGTAGGQKGARALSFNDFSLFGLLMQPINDAIHQFEADKPLLSQVLPTWRRLIDHAKEIDRQYSKKIGSKVSVHTISSIELID